MVSSSPADAPRPTRVSSFSQNTIHQNIYGKSLAITSTQDPQLATTIIENPEMLKYQQERQSSAQNNSAAAAAAACADTSTPKLNSVMNGESLEDIRKASCPAVFCPNADRLSPSSGS